MKIFFGWSIGWVTALIVVSMFDLYFNGTGDMNQDGELTIVDLSILAEEIRNSK